MFSRCGSKPAISSSRSRTRSTTRSSFEESERASEKQQQLQQMSYILYRFNKFSSLSMSSLVFCAAASIYPLASISNETSSPNVFFSSNSLSSSASVPLTCSLFSALISRIRNSNAAIVGPRHHIRFSLVSFFNTGSIPPCSVIRSASLTSQYPDSSSVVTCVLLRHSASSRALTAGTHVSGICLPIFSRNSRSAGQCRSDCKSNRTATVPSRSKCVSLGSPHAHSSALPVD